MLNKQKKTITLLSIIDIEAEFSSLVQSVFSLKPIGFWRSIRAFIKHLLLNLQ